jgi:nucleotide-binding universal stress UspA family protein
MQIRKILVPVDFSGHSRRAFDEATALAKTFGAELHLVHCYQFLPELIERYGVEPPRSFQNEIFEAARKRMDEWCSEVRALGLAVHSHMAENLPSKEMVDLAKQLGIDLIVMGTKGLSGLKHVVLGSVAERVVRLAPCPVITVNDHASTRPSRHIARILVPVDFSEHSRRAFEEAIGLAESYGAQLHLLHCYQLDPINVSPYGIVVPATFEQDIRRAALQRLSEWSDKAAALKLRVQEHIAVDFPSEQIVSTAERLAIDLIMMGTRGLTGFKHVLLGSVAERVIRHAPCPVLTVKTSL